MADVKITGLPAFSGTPAPNVLFEGVDDPSGTPTSRQFRLDDIHKGASALTDGGNAGRLDYFAGVLNSSGAARSFRGAALIAIINNLLTSGTFSLSDEIGLYQIAGSGARKRTVQQVFDLFGSLASTFTDPQTGDRVLAWDASASAAKGLALPDVLAVASVLTAFASTLDGANDAIALWDQSAGAMRKLTLDQLFQARHTIWIPARAWTPRTTNGPSVGTAELSTNKRMVASLDFDASVQEYAQFSFWSPKSWDLSTLAHRVAWTTATGTGGVAWSMAARADGDDDALDQAMGTAVVVTDTRIADNDLHITGESAAMTAAGTAQELDLVTLEVSRPVADAGDTKTGDAKFLGAHLYYNTRFRSDA